jgi:hypothetical protein
VTYLTALDAGRTAAENLMADTCRVDRPNGYGPIDESTGRETPVFTTIVTSTKCKMQSVALVADDVDTGGQVATLIRGVVHLPVTGTGTIRTDDIIVYLTTGTGSDPSLVGRRFRVIGPPPKTFATARRLTVEEVTS